VVGEDGVVGVTGEEEEADGETTTHTP
jgi:hypothetical protein